MTRQPGLSRPCSDSADLAAAPSAPSPALVVVLAAQRRLDAVGNLGDDLLMSPPAVTTASRTGVLPAGRALAHPSLSSVERTLVRLVSGPTSPHRCSGGSSSRVAANARPTVRGLPRHRLGSTAGCFGSGDLTAVQHLCDTVSHVAADPSRTAVVGTENSCCTATVPIRGDRRRGKALRAVARR